MALAHAQRMASPCEWRENYEGNWETVCGEMYCFEAGGPTENKQKFCG